MLDFSKTFNELAHKRLLLKLEWSYKCFRFQQINLLFDGME